MKNQAGVTAALALLRSFGFKLIASKLCFMIENFGLKSKSSLFAVDDKVSGLQFNAIFFSCSHSNPGLGDAEGLADTPRMEFGDGQGDDVAPADELILQLLSLVMA